MNERVWICVREIRRINLKIMYVSIRMKREFWTVIIVYTPYTRNGEIREEIDWFWEEMKGCIEVCEDSGKVVIIGNMN